MRNLTVFILLCLTWLAAACNLSQTTPPPQTGLSQAWLDAPRDGSVLPLAPYEVVFHGSNPEGVQQSEFSVNDQVQANPVSSQAGKSLVTFRVNWVPPAPGDYSLKVRSLSKGGIWSEYAKVHVIVAAPNLIAPSDLHPYINRYLHSDLYFYTHVHRYNDHLAFLQFFLPRAGLQRNVRQESDHLPGQSHTGGECPGYAGLYPLERIRRQRRQRLGFGYADVPPRGGSLYLENRSRRTSRCRLISFCQHTLSVRCDRSQRTSSEP